MIVSRSLSELGGLHLRSIVTVGNFDGVHCGHRMVIAAVRDRAAEVGAQAVAVTFDPHPAHVLRPEPRLPLITPLDQRLDLLATTGLDRVLVLPFTEDLRRWTARQFAEEVLRNALGAVELHEGESFRFGFDAKTGIEGLAALGQELGFAVHAWQPRQMRGAPVSSTRIRALLAAGRVHSTRPLLGRPFAVRSFPSAGRGFGSRYAVPTINLAPYPEILPANGVYITTLQVGSNASAVHFRGVTNVGNRPTFGPDSFAVETHLFDFHPLELTAATPLELTFLHRLRAEHRFASPEELRSQIGRDVSRARRYFALADALRAPIASPSR